MSYHKFISCALLPLYVVILVSISSCVKTPNNDSPYPLKYYGADSIKHVESMLAYCGVKLGMKYSRDSLEKNNWRYVDTYFQPYNPDKNQNIKSFYSDIYSEFEDRFVPNSAKCSVYRTLNENLVYEIDIVINRKDTTLLKAYLLKYGESNVTKFSNDHWGWEYKTQSINFWLKPDCTWIVYRDSTAIKKHAIECDSIKMEYSKALEAYKQKSIENI